MLLQKKSLTVLYLVLKGTEGVLSLADSRVRDSILKPLHDDLATYEADRKKIYERFCDVTESGEPDVQNDRYKFQPAVLEELNEEIEKLNAEMVELKEVPQFAEFIEKTTYSPKYGEAEIIDEILTKR